MKTPKFAYLIAFVLSSLLAYWWGTAVRPLGGAKKDYAATAVIRIHGLSPSARAGGAIAPDLDVNTVKQKALAQENIDRAARQILSVAPLETEARSGSADMESVVRLQNKLVVGVLREQNADATRISFTYTDKGPRTAANWVNALANSFADGCRQEWRERAKQAYRNAEEAAGRAAEELRGATSRLSAAGGPQVQNSRQAAATALGRRLAGGQSRLAGHAAATRRVAKAPGAAAGRSNADSPGSAASGDSHCRFAAAISGDGAVCSGAAAGGQALGGARRRPRPPNH